jgi:hypothetical protein
MHLHCNGIGAEGALALAGALKINTSLTKLLLMDNGIGNDGASALADALKVNTSVTDLNLNNTPGAYLYSSGNEIDKSKLDIVNKLLARNKRLRCMFLFDARRMLLSLMCADECGVVWPYLLEKGDKYGVAAPDNIESIRAEYSEVVAERCRRLSPAVPVVKRRRLE